MTCSKLQLAAKLSVDRRNFILSGSCLAALPWLAKIAHGYTLRNPSFQHDPFQMGVASGDPTHDGVVLWTRLCPPKGLNGLLPENTYEVTWEISTDDALRKIVRSGKSLAVAGLAHSVHVELQGLDPNRWYWYRFRCGDAESAVGKTRTSSRPSDHLDSLQFAFASCQHFETGLFTAYQHMAQEPLDLIVHLGDYIYEGAAQEKRLRKHEGPELITLQQYRSRYLQYKSDPHLIAAHASAPWLVVWDDHEFDNNYAADISEEKNVDPADFLLRRAAAYQAFYENMPLRAACLPQGPHLNLYRSVSFGNLVNFEMLDTRQYRSDQPNGDGNKPLVGDVLNPDATVLGRQQESWLLSELKASQAKWNVLAQQIMMARVDRGPIGEPRFSMDQWSGYDVPRSRLLQFLRDHKISNPVVLTGDIHSNWVNDLRVDFDKESSPTVATEFVGTSISSGGNGVAEPKGLDALLAKNPFVQFHNAERGYVRCTVSQKLWQSDYQVVESVTMPDSPLLTRATFALESGKPGARKS